MKGELIVAITLFVCIHCASAWMLDVPVLGVFRTFSRSSFTHLLVTSSTFFPISFYYFSHRQQKRGLFSKSNVTEKHLLPASGGDVNVLSLNIFLRPPFVHTNQDDYKNERLTEFIKVAGRYDIIALQEIFSFFNLRQRRMIREAKRIGFHYHAVSSYSLPFSLKIPFFDAGNLILSKFPIIEVDAHIYSAGVQIDGFVPKQVLYAFVQISKKHFLHVFTTHMQATYKENSEGVNTGNNNARKQQVVEMAQYIEKKVAGSPYPALITGDFNVNARVGGKAVTGGSEEYKFLMQCLTSYGMCSHLVKDLVHAHYDGAHPATYGDSHEHELTGELTPKDVVLTHAIDHHSRECLDYIVFRDTEENARAVRGLAPTTASFSSSSFSSSPSSGNFAPLESVVTSPQLRAKASEFSSSLLDSVSSLPIASSESESKGPCVKVLPGSTRIEPLFVRDPRLPFTQLSDHYAVTTTLSFS